MPVLACPPPWTRGADSCTVGDKGPVCAEPMCNRVSFLLSPRRYFTNISIGGRDYSFNSDGYLSNPLLDVISYINGRGWEEVSARLCASMLMLPLRVHVNTAAAISRPIRAAPLPHN